MTHDHGYHPPLVCEQCGGAHTRGSKRLCRPCLHKLRLERATNIRISMERSEWVEQPDGTLARTVRAS